MEVERHKCGFLSGFEVSVDGSKGGFCLAWKCDVIVQFSNNFIDASIKEDDDELLWRFTGFYGSPNANGRERFWNLLKGLANSTELH